MGIKYRIQVIDIIEHSQKANFNTDRTLFFLAAVYRFPHKSVPSFPACTIGPSVKLTSSIRHKVWSFKTSRKVGVLVLKNSFMQLVLHPLKGFETKWQLTPTCIQTYQKVKITWNIYAWNNKTGKRWRIIFQKRWASQELAGFSTSFGHSNR